MTKVRSTAMFSHMQLQTPGSVLTSTFHMQGGKTLAPVVSIRTEAMPAMPANLPVEGQLHVTQCVKPTHRGPSVTHSESRDLPAAVSFPRLSVPSLDGLAGIAAPRLAAQRESSPPGPATIAPCHITWGRTKGKEGAHGICTLHDKHWCSHW